MPANSTHLDLLNDLIGRARSAGADAADAVFIDGVTLTTDVRNGAIERLERSHESDVGLRVFVGRQSAVVSSADRSPRALSELAERAVAMARAVPEDPYVGLADPSTLARDWSDLDLEDPDEPAAEALLAAARTAEEAALAVPQVALSDSAGASWMRSEVAMAASNGFAGAYAVTSRSLFASVIAGEGTGMENEHAYATSVHAGDLESPEVIGRRAGERVAARLGARKVASQKVPVVFDPRVANSLIRHLLSAISGAAIARGTSFLKDSLGRPVFAPGVVINDEPHLIRGRRSRPFDGEGLPTVARALIDDGMLTTWLLDLRSARQLGLAPTGHAGRGVGSQPSPSATNVSLAPGTLTPEALMADIGSGLYVTQMMGMGVNSVTGDYSRGASGFWIEDGKIAYPVSELTVAGNLKEMFRQLTPANDLERRYGVDSPTVRIDGMTVAGQ